MKHQPKLAIMASLDAMDSVQAENVLQYIKDMLNSTNQKELEYARVKREAMKEIRQALLPKNKDLSLVL